MDGFTRKPLGGKSYGSIPHLPGSRLGPGDHHVNAGQERICTVQARELEVLRLVADGLGNRAIAERMRLHLSTVKTHVANIREALGVHSKIEAAVWYVRQEQAK